MTQPVPNLSVNDPDMIRLTQDCLTIAGRHYCSADELAVGTNRDARDGAFILVTIHRGPSGLHWQMTPAGARQIGQALLKLADLVDAERTQQAQDLLTAILTRDSRP